VAYVIQSWQNAFILFKRHRCQTLTNALEKSQNTKQFASLFSNELKCYYKFLIIDVLSNAWEENKEANCFVFCDFSKAFVKVWHRCLLNKMKAYGITGNLIDWFSSYLKGRRQKVVIKNNSYLTHRVTLDTNRW
jgi:hypothetical protein